MTTDYIGSLPISSWLVYCVLVHSFLLSYFHKCMQCAGNTKDTREREIERESEREDSGSMF